MFHLRRSNTKGSARSQIGVQEVRDNVLILPGNRYRTVLATSSVNFELQSEEEQDALVDTFQAFLNSLTVPIQILIRVRELEEVGVGHVLLAGQGEPLGQDVQEPAELEGAQVLFEVGADGAGQ